MLTTIKTTLGLYSFKTYYPLGLLYSVFLYAYFYFMSAPIPDQPLEITFAFLGMLVFLILCALVQAGFLHRFKLEYREEETDVMADVKEGAKIYGFQTTGLYCIFLISTIVSTVAAAAVMLNMKDSNIANLVGIVINTTGILWFTFGSILVTNDDGSVLFSLGEMFKLPFFDVLKIVAVVVISLFLFALLLALTLDLPLVMGMIIKIPVTAYIVAFCTQTIMLYYMEYLHDDDDDEDDDEDD